MEKRWEKSLEVPHGPRSYRFYPLNVHPISSLKIPPVFGKDSSLSHFPIPGKEEKEGEEEIRNESLRNATNSTTPFFLPLVSYRESAIESTRRRVELEAFAQIYTGPMTQMATSNGKETLEREGGGGGKERIAEIAR